MLGVSYTSFVRTSSPEHEKTVQTLLQKVWEQGDIYKKDYEACTACPANLSGPNTRWRKPGACARTAAVLWKK